MDLDIELQEEVLVSQWHPGQRRETDEGCDLLPIEMNDLPLEVRLDRGPSGIPLRDKMSQIVAKENRPPIYGVVHYESCRLVLQPLSVLDDTGIEYLTVSHDKINQAELVKAMKFT
jgi:hypothetical protein